jgi:hypothetical protein
LEVAPHDDDDDETSYETLQYMNDNNWELKAEYCNERMSDPTPVKPNETEEKRRKEAEERKRQAALQKVRTNATKTAQKKSKKKH